MREYWLDQMSQEESDEIHVVFNRYDVELSPKSATRVRRKGGRAGVLQDNRLDPHWKDSDEETFVS